MPKSLLVFFGGGAGSLARYAVQQYLAKFDGLPWLQSTFLVNVVGSFFMGAIMAMQMSSLGRLALTTGFLGGFTTYSALNQELLVWIRQGQWLQAATYLMLLLGSSLLSAFLGAWLSQSLTGA